MMYRENAPRVVLAYANSFKISSRCRRRAQCWITVNTGPTNGCAGSYEIPTAGSLLQGQRK